MNTNDPRADVVSDIAPEWRCPTLSSFDISAITQLGKLGSLFDANTGASDFAEE